MSKKQKALRTDCRECGKTLPEGRSDMQVCGKKCQNKNWCKRHPRTSREVKP